MIQLGCGVTGLVCAEHLEKNRRVDELVLADKQIGPAESLVERIDTDKAVPFKTDLSDPSDLKKLMKGCDLVISSVPSEMNPRLLQAALAMGIDYVDFTIPLETIPKFDETQKACTDAGIRALTAVGEDPGISDVFALHGAGKLDEVHEIHIKDADNAVSDEHEVFTLWCPRDMMEEITMEAAVYDNGQIKWLPPLSRHEKYKFPEPIGSHTIYNTTHEETFLIPKFLKGVRYVDFMIVVSDKLAETANMLRRMGLHGLKPIMVDGVSVKPLDVVTSLMPNPADMVGTIKGSAGIIVEAVGIKNGERRMAKTWVEMTHEDAYRRFSTSATGYLVGTGAAVGAEMLVAGDVKHNGFFVPEMLPTEKYIEKLRRKHLEVHETFVAI